MSDYERGFVDALQVTRRAALEAMDPDHNPDREVLLDIIEKLWNQVEDERVHDLLEEHGIDGPETIHPRL